MKHHNRIHPYFVIERFSNDSSEKMSLHRKLVSKQYRRAGFIGKDELISDIHDNEEAVYYLLRCPTSGLVKGTFRTVCFDEKTKLPMHTTYPELFENGMTHTCESTRVAGNNNSGKTSPSEHVLFEVVIQSMALAKIRGLSSAVSLGTPSIRKWIVSVFGEVQHQLGPARYLSGGEVLPYIGYVDEFEKIIQKNSCLWQCYTVALKQW